MSGSGPPHGGHEEEEEGGAPEWLISFADMVMLIMGFFVILFALNISPKEAPGGAEGDGGGAGGMPESMVRWEEFVYHTRMAFNNPIPLDTADPKLRKVIDWYHSDGPGRAESEGPEGDHENVTTVRPGDYFPVEGSSVIFEDGASTLTPRARRTLAELAERMRGLPAIIEIRGHAGVVESRGDPRTGFDLSYDRAGSVARELFANGIPWRRFRIVAAGEFDRIERHPDDRAADAVNPRVEVTLRDEFALEEVRTAPPGRSD